ncbi:general substrate transporter [Lipomyces oligophaga]|uniref:general substrate transporter n=1 Tax=Lipomyces oligophaga TaxID=45792 RepID=UPI0034D004A6
MAPAIAISSPGDADLAAAYGPVGFRGLFQNSFVLLLAVCSSFGGLLFGYDQGVMSGILVMNNFARVFPQLANNDNLQGWIVSVLQLGACIGSLVNGPIADKYSRKYAMSGACCIFILGAAIQTGVQNTVMFFFGRFFAGFGIGQLSMTVPLYLGEIAPPNVRGSIITLQQFGITVGIMVSFWINYGTQYIGGTGDGQLGVAWRLPLGLQLIPPVILLFSSVFVLPFSPRWLYIVDRPDEALISLARIRRLPVDDERIQREILAIKISDLFDRKTMQEKFPEANTKFKQDIRLYIELIRVPHLRRRLFRSCEMQVIQQFTGINALIYYAPKVFGFIGMDGNSTRLLATGVIGIINVLFSFVPFFLLDKIGRRPILIIGGVGMAISQIIVATIYACYDNKWDTNKSAGWACAVFIWVYIANFAYSIACVNWIYPSEIFPPFVRSKAMSIAIAVNWLFCFIVGLVTPRMLTSIKFGTFYFFFAFCIILIFWTYFLIPETKGVAIEDMDKIWGGNSAAEDVRRLELITKEVGSNTSWTSGYDKASHENLELAKLESSNV